MKSLAILSICVLIGGVLGTDVVVQTLYRDAACTTLYADLQGAILTTYYAPSCAGFKSYACENGKPFLYDYYDEECTSFQKKTELSSSCVSDSLLTSYSTYTCGPLPTGIQGIEQLNYIGANCDGATAISVELYVPNVCSNQTATSEKYSCVGSQLVMSQWSGSNCDAPVPSSYVNVTASGCFTLLGRAANGNFCGNLTAYLNMTPSGAPAVSANFLLLALIAIIAYLY